MTNRIQMSDIKNVLGLLCKHLSLLLDVTLKPECFRLAKYNSTAENVSNTFWVILHSLSSHAAREKRSDVDFEEYDAISATKLYFAYLQYPVVDFYGLTRTSSSNRELLIAFAWLLTTQDALNTMVRAKVADSILGRECAPLHTSELITQKLESESSEPCMQMHNILHVSSKINHNIKAIAELISERSKSVTKIHTASANVSGLSHLSVLDLALVKRFLVLNKSTFSGEDREQLQQLNLIGSILNTHVNWSKKEHVFFDWMESVIQESKKTAADSSTPNPQEVSKFISLLNSVINEHLESLSPEGAVTTVPNINTRCVSRLLRTQEADEISSWRPHAENVLHQHQQDLRTKKEELSAQLKSMLKLIPSCFQVK